MGLRVAMNGNIWSVLDQSPGRYALVHGPDTDITVVSIANDAGLDVTHVGTVLTAEQAADRLNRPERALRGARVLSDIDVLFWPEVVVDPLRLFAMLSHAQPVVIAWPGSIRDGRVRYSAPGRPDHYDAALPSKAVVLRSRPSSFPDELPYEAERVR